MSNLYDFDVPSLERTAERPTRHATHHRCVDCRELSPRVETSFTLISSRYGWRLHREQDTRSGQVVMDWRCPECWARFRLRRRQLLRPDPDRIGRSAEKT